LIFSPGKNSFHLNKPLGSQSIIEENFQGELVDLSVADVSSLSSEVAILVTEVIDERVRQINRKENQSSYINDDSKDELSYENPGRESPELAMKVTFKEFNQLVACCLRKKEGRPGRSYLFVPKKDPNVRH
jgi:hypothetical protein